MPGRFYTMRVEIQSRELERAFSKCADIASRELDIALKDSGEEVVREARANHWFTDRNRDASRSIRSQLNKGTKTASVFLDTGIATYSEYLHDGTRYMKGGPFVEDAVKEKQGYIENEIENAIDRIFKKAGF